MADLPTRLRNCRCLKGSDEAVCREAADTIEHLRRMLDWTEADDEQTLRIKAQIDRAAVFP